MRSCETAANGQNSGLDPNGYSSPLLEGYDEPEILHSSTRLNCLIGADAGQGRYPLQAFLEVESVGKPELGNKHHCQNCGTRFFDLHKSPTTCPKCGAISQAAPLPRAAPHAAGSSLQARSRFRTATMIDNGEPPAGTETVLDLLVEADVGDNKGAVVADDDVEIEIGDDPFLEEENEDADDVGDEE